MEKKSRKGLGLLLAGVVAVAASGALVFAHSGGGHGPGHLDSDGMAQHFQEHVRHVLAEVDATADQRARIDVILDAAVNDLKALQGQHPGMFAGMHTLLTAPAIDRVKLEQLRAEHIATLDAASQRCATALADAAEVLTPEQRAKLDEEMKKRHS